MKQTLSKKWISIALCLLLASLTLFTSTVACFHPHGHCVPETCVVCLSIRTLQSLLRLLSLFALGLTGLLGALVLSFSYRVFVRDPAPHAQTLISLKVRLNP